MFEDDNQNLSLDFSSDQSAGWQPLAERLRPDHINAYIGQSHLLGPGKPLRQLLEQGRAVSMILWGPPGTGKTTLARLLANAANAHVISLSATLAGVKDVRAAVEAAQVRRQSGQRTILFVDEVHRFNKAQQDAFLPHVENGTVTFIGATTENPSFEVNNALLSRARVFVLKSLSEEELLQVVNQAVAVLGLEIDATAAELLVQAADGDARRLLNVIELAAQLTEGELTSTAVAAALGDTVRRFDKGGDVFYEQISALHKSVRGSQPDAALYWFCRMLDGGADPRYLGRRLIRIASEDVGNADPRALDMTLSAVATYERLGSPEGELALAQAVLYLASVPKSDAAYQAFNAAMAFVRDSPSLPVPLHLRNAPTNLMSELGYGGNYRHAHNETTTEGAYAAGEQYFPDGVSPPTFYQPTNQGLEAKIASRLARLADLDARAQTTQISGGPGFEKSGEDKQP